MRAGILSETITILRPIELKSGTGSSITTYDKFADIRAGVKYKSRVRDNENGDLTEVRGLEFIVRRFYQEIPLNYRIFYHGKQYRILDVIPGEYQDCTIAVELINE